MRIYRQSFPLEALKNEDFRRIEPGVNGVVRWLCNIDACPVWSCEGHKRDSRHNEWFPDDIWVPFVRGRPYVVCAGPRYSTKGHRGAVYVGMRMLDEGFGPLRLFVLHVPDHRGGNDLLRRIRWTQHRRSYFAIVFQDQLAALPGKEQGRCGRREEPGIGLSFNDAVRVLVHKGLSS